ncbi:MAG: Ig domain-containing protein [Promicromonosporaceae bacterium]|nr:Ig domain-containing protein [Promicromonosporaceae bacterium]
MLHSHLQRAPLRRDRVALRAARARRLNRRRTWRGAAAAATATTVALTAVATAFAGQSESPALDNAPAYGEYAVADHDTAAPEYLAADHVAYEAAAYEAVVADLPAGEDAAAYLEATTAPFEDIEPANIGIEPLSSGISMSVVIDGQATHNARAWRELSQFSDPFPLTLTFTNFGSETIPAGEWQWMVHRESYTPYIDQIWYNDGVHWMRLHTVPSQLVLGECVGAPEFPPATLSPENFDFPAGHVITCDGTIVMSAPAVHEVPPNIAHGIGFQLNRTYFVAQTWRGGSSSSLPMNIIQSTILEVDVTAGPTLPDGTAVVDVDLNQHVPNSEVSLWNNGLRVDLPGANSQHLIHNVPPGWTSHVRGTGYNLWLQILPPVGYYVRQPGGPDTPFVVAPHGPFEIDIHSTPGRPGGALIVESFDLSGVPTNHGHTGASHAPAGSVMIHGPVAALPESPDRWMDVFDIDNMVEIWSIHSTVEDTTALTPWNPDQTGYWTVYDMDSRFPETAPEGLNWERGARVSASRDGDTCVSIYEYSANAYYMIRTGWQNQDGGLVFPLNEAGVMLGTFFREQFTHATYTQDVTVPVDCAVIDGDYAGPAGEDGNREVVISAPPGSEIVVGPGNNVVVTLPPGTAPEHVIVNTPPDWTVTPGLDADGNPTVTLTPPPGYLVTQPGGPGTPIIVAPVPEEETVPPVGPRILSQALPPGTVGTPFPYQVRLEGTGPLAIATTAGELPAGLSKSGNPGLVSGTPTQVGTFTWTAVVTDANGLTYTRELTMQVVAPGAVAPTIPTLPVTGAAIAAAAIAATGLIGAGLLFRQAGGHEGGDADTKRGRRG